MSDLVTLTAAAKQAATQYEHLERSSVEARREQVLVYGRALREIRALIPSDRAFAKHLDAHQLAIRDSVWRSNAMWLAKEVDGLVISLNLCPYANPTDIRRWRRKQDPNYQPKPRKKGGTTAGQSDATNSVRDYIRPLIEKGETIAVQDVVAATGKSRIVVEAAIAAERGRVEGLAAAPVDVLELAEALGLGQKAKDRLAALIRRQEREYEVRVQDETSRRVRKHIDEVLEPMYQAQLTEADRRLAKYRPPMSKAEYRLLVWALHEDQTDAKRRAEAFALVHKLKVVLGGAEAEDLKPRTLPSTVEELLKRRKRPMPGFRARA